MKFLCIYEGENPSAAIVNENKIEMFIEEERLNRVKHSSNIFPIRAIQRVLKDCNLKLNGIDGICIPWDLDAYEQSKEVQTHYELVNKEFPPDSGTLNWQARNLKQRTKQNMTEHIRFNLARYFGNIKIPPLYFTKHHKAHAWAGLIGSGFKESLILVIDGSSETLCTSVWQYKNFDLEYLWGEKIPNSLGWLYTAVTEYLGFDAKDGEYKVMGIAGMPCKSIIPYKTIQKIIQTKEDGSYSINPKYIHHGSHMYSMRFTDELKNLLGFSPRSKNDELTDQHIAFAKAIQEKTQQVLIQIAKRFLCETNHRNLVLSGGVALNVKANGCLLSALDIDSVYVNPFPNDTGSAIGVVLEHNKKSRESLTNKIEGLSFLGPIYSKDEIEKVIKSSGYEYRLSKEPAKELADYINSGKIIALSQGRSECGQRALGNRSIIGDPRSKSVASKINNIIKRREPWRPLCPSILDTDINNFSIQPNCSPYMMIAVESTALARETIPAVIHCDGSIRPQIVTQTDAPLFYDIIKGFKILTGIGAVINTSFNIDGQPIVESPKDAISTFATTDIDILFLDGYILSKRTNA